MIPSPERVACLVGLLLFTACPGPETSAPKTTTTAPAAPGPGMSPPDAGEPGEARPASTEPAPTPTPPAANGEPSGVMNGIVAAHNEARALHCAPPLTWSPEIAAVAQAWADKLRDAGCAFEHSPGGKYGENLSYLSPAGIGRPEAITRGWYDEVRDYDFRKPVFGMNTGHFTQVVWRATERIGCGVARCADAELWVCNYDPYGNVRGEFREQVLPTGCNR